jgi:nitrogenase molybdenum-iron protein alpha chain
MDYIKEKAPPVREDRLKACNAFGGSCCSLNKSTKKGCLNSTKRSFSQTQGCQLNLSLAILNTIRDAVLIIHGPLGCGGGSVAVAGLSKGFKKLRDSSSKGLIWLNTNLDEADVINGGEAKLREAVLYADKEFRPGAIVVLNSCVPAIIGDDIDNLLSSLQTEVSAKIVPVHCEGFKTKIMATAYDAVYHGILRNLLTETKEEDSIIDDEIEVLKRKLQVSKTVNVLNVSSMSRVDEDELTRILKALDLNTRFLPCYSHPEDFGRVQEAALNVSICATHDDYFVEHIKDIYGIPFILKTIPIGIKHTNIWIRDIAKFFGIEEAAERFIESETRLIAEAIAPFKKILHGKKVFLAGGEIRVVTTAELLQSLGMEVIGMKGYHFDQFGNELLEELPGNDEIVFNVATGQPFEQANILERIRPDVYVGHIGGNVWAAKQGIPVFPIFGQTINYLGYQGVFEFARRIARLLRNPSFNESIAENTRLPYHKEWYKDDPFKYIDQSEALTG